MQVSARFHSRSKLAAELIFNTTGCGKWYADLNSGHLMRVTLLIASICLQKCMPGGQRCKRCTELNIEDCTYSQKKKRVVGELLRVGEACLPCRSVTSFGRSYTSVRSLC